MIRQLALVAALLSTFALPATASAERPNPLQDGATWEHLRPSYFADRPIQDGAGRFSLDAPFRAQDAATVPVRFQQADPEIRVVRLTLLVDENPAPFAAEFEFGPDMGAIDLETRLRVNAYSNVRAIAETEDGTLYMVGRYVRASGGCSAPAARDMEAAMAQLGRTHVRWIAPEAQPEDRRMVQVMVRHPSNSGLQRDQITHHYIPAWYVDRVEIHQGGALLFTMTGGITLSEDPSFRFSYSDNGAGGLSIRAGDIRGGEYGGDFRAGL